MKYLWLMLAVVLLGTPCRSKLDVSGSIKHSSVDQFEIREPLKGDRSRPISNED
jgi:hypothetical protein